MRSLLCVFMFASLVSCQRNQDSNPTFSADDSAQNGFVGIFAANDLPGVAADERNMRQNLAKLPSFQQSNSAIINDNVKSLTIADVERALTQVISRLGPLSTLWIAYSGHGAEGDGRLVLDSNGVYLTASQLISMINRIAAGKNIARLVITLDSCFSGAYIQAASNGSGGTVIAGNANSGNASENGNFDSLATLGSGNVSGAQLEQLINQTAGQFLGGTMTSSQIAQILNGQGSGFANQGDIFTPNMGRPTPQQIHSVGPVMAFGNATARGSNSFKQFLALSSSTADQTSADLGSQQGGALTYAITQVMQQELNNRAMTVGDFIDKVKSRTSLVAGGSQDAVAIVNESQVTKEMFWDNPKS